MTEPLTPPPTSRQVADFYRRRIEAHGLSYQAQWGEASDTKSEQRYSALKRLPILEGDVVVDIGCGVGSLAQYLRVTAPPVSYIGIELTPEFAAAARTLQGVEVLEIDALRQADQLPAADWYVVFGTLNTRWLLEGMPGTDDEDRVLNFLGTLFHMSRKGIAATLVTDQVDYLKPQTCNMNPIRVAERLAGMSRAFRLDHDFTFREFFAAAWRQGDLE